MASPELSNLTGLLAGGRITPAVPDADARAAYDAMGTMLPTAPGTSTTTVEVGGVPAEWVEADRAGADRVALHLHGGGYVIGSCTSHRAFASHLSRALDARVLLLDYRLAPEHPHPAAVDDAVAAYRALLDSAVDARRLVVTGDSAGGGLAISLLLALCAGRARLPAAAGVISPFVDLTCSAPSIASNAATDVVLSPDLVRHWGDRYRAGLPPDDPRVSPLFADLVGLPPLVVHASAREILLDDATHLVERARDAGVPVTLDVVDDVPHHWHVWAGLVPEADEAVGRLGRQLGQLLDAAASHE